MEEDLNTMSINSLPNEIFLLILHYSDCRDILNFGLTCKQFNEIVNNNQCIWKEQFKRRLPSDMYHTVIEHYNGEWFKEFKRFYYIKKEVHSELLLMSPKYYGQNKIPLEDVKNFFTIALSHNLSYYYVIYLLQEVITKGNHYTDEFVGIRPYTLTEMYYAKVVLQFLIHTFQTVKWLQSKLMDRLSPYIVVNFFLQWADTENIYLDEDIKNNIPTFVEQVNIHLQNKFSEKLPGRSIDTKRAAGLIIDRQILEAISHVMYIEMKMKVTTAANLDLLNINKVINNKCGNMIAVAAIYEAVANEFKIKCDLIAFHNHLFLEWKWQNESNTQMYTINLLTGELHFKRRCPFSQKPSRQLHYCSESLLQYIYSTMRTTREEMSTWNKVNASDLVGFLITDTNVDVSHPYKELVPHILHHSNSPGFLAPINLKHFSDLFLLIFSEISSKNTNPKNVFSKEIIVKKRKSNIKYAVGMICCHKQYGYVCAILSWDANCAHPQRGQMDDDQLEFSDQPYYNVIAMDQSHRYIAQEKLVEISYPSRLEHLEDVLARLFTHFDGFAYIPNNETQFQYPEDMPILQLHRNRSISGLRAFRDL